MSRLFGFSDHALLAHLLDEAAFFFLDLTRLLGESEREAAPGGEAVGAGVSLDSVTCTDSTTVGHLENEISETFYKQKAEMKGRM
jgi:hypothetical protein